MKRSHRLFIVQPIGRELTVSHDQPVSGNVDYLIGGREIIRLIPGWHPQASRGGAATGPEAFVTSFRPRRTHPMESTIRCVVGIRIPHEDIGLPPADESPLW